MAIFHISNYLASKWRNRLIPLFRVSSDMTGHTKAGSNTRINYIINQRTRSDLEISRSNSALTSSNSRFRTKTHGLCVPNLVPKKENFGTFLSSFWQLASSSLIPWPYCFYLSYAYLLNKIRFNNYNGSSARSTFYVVHLIHVFFSGTKKVCWTL